MPWGYFTASPTMISWIEPVVVCKRYSLKYEVSQRYVACRRCNAGANMIVLIKQAVVIFIKVLEIFVTRRQDGFVKASQLDMDF